MKFINMNKLSWPTIVGGNPKAPFSIATTLRCKGEGALLLYLDSSTCPKSIPYNAEF